MKSIKGEKRKPGSRGLLTGLLFTPDGKRMSATTTSHGYEIYASQDGSVTIQRELLDSYVRDVFESAEAEEPDTDAAQLADYESELAEAQMRLKRVNDYFHRRGEMTQAEYDDVAPGLRQEIDVLEARIEIAKQSIWRPTGEMVDLGEGAEVDWFDGLLFEPRSIAEWWDGLDLDSDDGDEDEMDDRRKRALAQRRALLRTRIEKVIVDTDQAGIAIAKAGMTDWEWRRVRDKGERKTAARTTVVFCYPG